MLRPKVIATDWVWLIDHSIQIGTCKILVILGIRLSDLPEGRPLCHQDMEPIALVPMTSSTKQTVAARAWRTPWRGPAYRARSSTIMGPTFTAASRSSVKPIPRQTSSTTSSTRRRAC